MVTDRKMCFFTVYRKKKELKNEGNNAQWKLPVSLHPSLLLSPVSVSICLSEEYFQSCPECSPTHSPPAWFNMNVFPPSLKRGGTRRGSLHNEVMKLYLEHSASLTTYTPVFAHAHVCVCVCKWLWIDDESISGALSVVRVWRWASECACHFHHFFLSVVLLCYFCSFSPAPLSASLFFSVLLFVCPAVAL